MITTHVLDTSRGRPASGVPVLLEQGHGADDWRVIARSETDADGRVKSFNTASSHPPGVYRLVFDTRTYFEKAGVKAFYPQVMIVFETAAGEPHYHVPLLLGPFGYTTYRGS
ncbi:MAG: hydroxyisourate hydrolase [Vicinamibacterales bacterium]